ncbi:MAG: hypothetical protein WBX01_01695 [Nitrososphaeraceae archaeon]
MKNPLTKAKVIAVVMMVSLLTVVYVYQLAVAQTTALEKAKLSQYFEEMQLSEKILAVETQCKNLPLNSSIEDLMLCIDFIEKFAEQLKPEEYTLH